MTPAAAVSSPVGWDWVEGRIVLPDVSHASDPAIRRGDAVIAINGQPANDALAAAEAEIFVRDAAVAACAGFADRAAL